LFTDDLAEQAEVFKEVILILVLGVDFEYADDPVVLGFDKVVELRAICERNHAVDDVLAEDLV